MKLYSTKAQFPLLYKVNALKSLPNYLFLIYDRNLTNIIALFENVTNICSLLSIMDIVFETWVFFIHTLHHHRWRGNNAFLQNIETKIVGRPRPFMRICDQTTDYNWSWSVHYFNDPYRNVTSGTRFEANKSLKFV